MKRALEPCSLSQNNQDGSQKQSQQASGTPSKTSRFLKPPRSAITKRAKQCDQNRPPAIAMELIGGLSSAQNHSLVSPALHIDDTPHTGAHQLLHSGNTRPMQAWPTSAQRKFASLTVLTPSETDTLGLMMDSNSTLSRELSLRVPSSQVSSLETHRVSSLAISPVNPEAEPEEDDSFILFSQHDYVRGSQANFTPLGSDTDPDPKEPQPQHLLSRDLPMSHTGRQAHSRHQGGFRGLRSSPRGLRDECSLDQEEPLQAMDRCSYLSFAPPSLGSSQPLRDEGLATSYPASQPMAFGSQFSHGPAFSLPNSQAGGGGGGGGGGAFSLPGSQTLVCDSLLGGLAAVKTSRASRSYGAGGGDKGGTSVPPLPFLEGPSGTSQDSSMLRVSLLTRSLHTSGSQGQGQGQGAPVLPSSLSQGQGQGSVDSPLDKQVLLSAPGMNDASQHGATAVAAATHPDPSDPNPSSLSALQQPQPMTAKGLICAFRNSTDNESAETPELQHCHDGTNSARESLGGPGDIQPPSATGKGASNQVSKPSRMFSIFLPKSQQRHVIIIRHGESEFNRAVDECRDFQDPMIFDPDLTSKGRTQARELRSKLASQITNHGDALWVVSPLRRTIQTFLEACPLIPLPPSPRLHPSLSAFPSASFHIGNVMPPPLPFSSFSSLSSFNSRSEPLYTVGSSTATLALASRNIINEERQRSSSHISVETSSMSNAGQSAFSFSFSSVSFSNSSDAIQPMENAAGPSAPPFPSPPSSSSLPSSSADACKLAHAQSSPPPLAPQLNVIVLPTIAEFLTTAGDVGSPASALAAEFPILANQISTIPEHWWFSSEGPAKKVNCAKSQQLNTLEPKDHRSKRVRDFERWLSSRPEKFIILVGHCQFWHDFRGKKEKKMYNGEMRSFRW